MYQLQCPHFCGQVEPTLTYMQAKNGQPLMKATCPVCQSYIRFVPPTGAWYSMYQMQQSFLDSSPDT